ncbi:MAG TPA: metalloregulator ArsR/SmtB family transcription factor [Terriglobales bacterium]|nr:metalloregulator ArsR/SmtB family transcription factor [Terriglobales bacterium]
MRHRSVTYSGHGGRGGSRALTGDYGGGRDLAFNALADPTRRAVLDLLRAGTRPAGEIARAFPVSRPAISKHLRILRRAHLVQERKEGRHRFYQLNPEPLKAVDSWLEHYRQFWTASLQNLKEFVEAEYEKEQAAKPSIGKREQEPK